MVRERSDQTEPEERVVSPRFDLERERAAAAAWAQRQCGLVTLELEPEPEPEPEREPEDFREPADRNGSTTVLAAPSSEVALVDDGLDAQLAEVLSERQQKDLADIFHAAAGAPRGTLDVTRLRAVLRAIGCERLCTNVLQQLVELRGWNAAQGPGRRPPLPALHGMAVLDMGKDAAETAISFEDFLRVMMSGSMRGYLSEMDFSVASRTLLQLTAAFDMAVNAHQVQLFLYPSVCLSVSLALSLAFSLSVSLSLTRSLSLCLSLADLGRRGCRAERQVADEDRADAVLHSDGSLPQCARS